MELFSIRIQRTFQLVSTAQVHMIVYCIASACFQKSLYVVGKGGKLEVIDKTAETAPDKLRKQRYGYTLRLAGSGCTHYKDPPEWVPDNQRFVSCLQPDHLVRDGGFRLRFRLWLPEMAVYEITDCAINSPLENQPEDGSDNTQQLFQDIAYKIGYHSGEQQDRYNSSSLYDGVVL